MEPIDVEMLLVHYWTRVDQRQIFSDNTNFLSVVVGIEALLVYTITRD